MGQLERHVLPLRHRVSCNRARTRQLIPGIRSEHDVKGNGTMKSGRKAYLLVFGCLMLLSLRAFANNPVLLPDTSFDYSIVAGRTLLQTNNTYKRGAHLIGPPHLKK